MTDKNTVVPALLAQLVEHQGEVVRVEELATETGLDLYQVKTGMYRLVRDQKWPVETIQKGHLWKIGHQAGAETDPDRASFSVVEHLGGALVLADPDGGLWLAKRIGVTS